MLTMEELLLATRALRQRGYQFTYYFGTAHEGYTLRASKHPPLSEPWWKDPYIEIREAHELRRYLER